MRSRRCEREPLLEQLLDWHRKDVPGGVRRERLLTKLRRSGPTEVLSVCQVPGVPAIPGFEGRAGPASAGRWQSLRSRHGPMPTAPLLAAAAAGFLLALCLGSWWHGMRGATPGIAARAPAASGLTVSSETELPRRSCFAASGVDGLLWSTTQRRPSLPERDGRSGVWFHHWGQETGGVMAPARVARLDGRGPERFELEVMGERAAGWGAKLSAGLRVRQVGHSDVVRFDCYDASEYAGLKFRARGSGIVFVLLQTLSSVPIELGGRCRSRCWFTGSHAVVLGPEFSDYLLAWDRFSGPAEAEALQAQLMLVEFFIQPTDQPYQVGVEEVALLTRSELAVTEQAAAGVKPGFRWRDR